MYECDTLEPTSVDVQLFSVNPRLAYNNVRTTLLDDLNSKDKSDNNNMSVLQIS